MDRGDYRLLPKGLRRMLVFSETFFFREYGKAKIPKKTRREEVRKTSSSLAFCECQPYGSFLECQPGKRTGLRC
jgi:hypothetical protein